VGAGGVVAVQRRFVGAPGPGRGGTLPRGSVREAGVHDADLGVHDVPIRLFTFPILVFTMIRSCCSRCADPGVHDRPKHASSGTSFLEYIVKYRDGGEYSLNMIYFMQVDLDATGHVSRAFVGAD
jgi:hypothetical protein